MARHTIANPFSLSGTGLHGAVPVTVTFRPAPSGTGIVFRRVDLPGAPSVPAHVECVGVDQRRTGVERDGVTVLSVEHLMAAIFALELDDLHVELDAPELPAMDGSAAPYAAALATCGRHTLAGAPLEIISPPMEVREGDAHYLVEPAEGLTLTVTIDWTHPLIGRQTGTFDIAAGAFGSELAAARTFGFTRDRERLMREGLALGADIENTVVLSDDVVVNGPLRWPDEFVRHKAVDLLGDLALTGGRLHAHVTAMRPSHRGNVALARSLHAFILEEINR